MAVDSPRQISYLDDQERSITCLLSGHVDTSLNIINMLGLFKEVSVIIEKDWSLQPWNSPQKKKAKPVLDSQYLAMKMNNMEFTGKVSINNQSVNFSEAGCIYLLDLQSRLYLKGST